MRAAIRSLGVLASVAALVVLPSSAAAAGPTPDPYQHNDFGGFNDILPAGTNGLVNAPQLLQFQLDGTRPPHNNDQYGMYRDVMYATPGLASGDIRKYYKDASFGVKSDDVERTYSPCEGATVVRDKGFGVPHIYGTTREAAMCAIGYATGEDRLFLIDALRHAGRGELSSFAGGSNRGMDESVWADTPYTEQDLLDQYNYAPPGREADANLLRSDAAAYNEGLNRYIAEARLNPLKMPAEYAATLNLTGPENFKPTDQIAIASLVGGIFGKGGGNELGAANVLDKAKARFGTAAGGASWKDFRTAEDPEAPTTVHSGSFPYEVPPKTSKGLALPDAGSLERTNVVASSSGNPDPASILDGIFGGAFPTGASNALLVSARESQSGRPIAVMGPQVAYFAPQILMEQDVHAPTLDARGAAFPGVNLYVQLGRGRDYSWSATSAGQDVVDTFAVPLCNPDSSPPTKSSDHYMFRGQCLPFEVLTKTISWIPNPGDQTAAGSETMRTLRSKMGIVIARGTVGGKPVAYTKLRTTYFHEADSALGFSDFNDPDKMRSPADFQRAAHKIFYTFNWFYADNKNIAYFNSGANPVRHPSANPNLPTFAQYEWRGYNPDALTEQQLPEDLTPSSQHPQVVNQSYLSSWNNKPAKGYRAADDNFAYGSIYRVDSLDRRIEAGITGSRKMNLAGLISAMEDAGTVDMRARETLPYLLEVLRSQRVTDPELLGAVSKLRGWLNQGAHRIDRDKSGSYESSEAIKIMDAWWPLLLHAEFEPALGTNLFEALHSMIKFDDAPNAHVGSAYNGGWYHYVHRDLRTVLRTSSGRRLIPGRYSRVYCGGGRLTLCRSRLLAALKNALDDNPYGENGGCGLGDDQVCYDAVKFRAVGGVGQPDLQWINRPTYQQAVEIQGHR